MIAVLVEEDARVLPRLGTANGRLVHFRLRRAARAAVRQNAGVLFTAPFFPARSLFTGRNFDVFIHTRVVVFFSLAVKRSLREAFVLAAVASHLSRSARVHDIRRRSLRQTAQDSPLLCSLRIQNEYEMLARSRMCLIHCYNTLRTVADGRKLWGGVGGLDTDTDLD